MQRRTCFKTIWALRMPEDCIRIAISGTCMQYFGRLHVVLCHKRINILARRLGGTSVLVRTQYVCNHNKLGRD